jgi:predicted phage tail protein
MNTATAKPRKATKAREKKFITVKRITNPFEPFRAIEVDKWPYRKNKSLAAYLPQVFAEDYVISMNGGIVPHAVLAKTYPQPDDYVVMCPIPRGGGGKGIFRIVGMIAVAIAAVYTGGLAMAAYGAATGVAAGVTTTGMMVAGMAASMVVSIAGSLLVNALLPAASTSGASSISNSASYGADGAKNTSSEGIPVPVVYGNGFRTAGNIIGMFTEANTSGSDAANNGNNQFLYMLINAGEGPIAGISDIQLNGRAISEFANVTTQTRLGYSTQAPIDWFNKVISPVSKQIMLPSDGSWISTSTLSEVEQVRLDFNCPSGLYSVNKKNGSFESNSVSLNVQYRPYGSTKESDWVPMGSDTETSYSNVIVYPTVNGLTIQTMPENAEFLTIDGLTVFQSDGANGSAAQVTAAYNKYGGYVGRTLVAWPGSAIAATPAGVSMTVQTTGSSSDLHITDNLRSTVRRSFTSPQLTMGKYEFRIRRDVNYSIQTYDPSGNGVLTSFPTDTSDTSQSDTYLTDLNEITFDEVAYNHTALLAIRVQMDDQLSGVPTVSFLHGGKLITVYQRSDGSQTTSQLPSTNPAWIWLDAATNPIYGAGIDLARIDMDSVYAWASYCTSAGLTWNGPLDQTMTFWDASALILRVGHAQVIQVGTRFYVATEAPSEPVMMFGMGNIVKDTFKMTWLGQNDRATEIDVTYYDKNDYNKAHTVKVVDPTLAQSGKKQNPSAITLYGVDNITTAYKEGAFQLNLNRYLSQTVSFDAPLEAIACTPGDVILVQHDMPNWAQSGRLEVGSTASVLKLDKPVSMDAGKNYKVLLLTNYVVRGTPIVQSVIGNFVQIVGGVNSAVRVNRIRAAGGQETSILSMVPDGVYVDDVTGFAAGQMATLFDTDVVTDADVMTVAGTTDTITLKSGLSYAPEQFTNYMFGEATKVKKPFRVKSITLATSSLNRHITALEYNEAVYDLSSYDDVTSTLVAPTLPAEAAAISEVLSLSVYEETYVSGTQILSDVRAAWDTPQVGSYAGADVYMAVNGSGYSLYRSVAAATSCVISGLAAGDKITVKVVAYDVWGKRAAYDNAPTQSYTVIGYVGNIAVADVSGADFVWAGRDCKLYWNYNSVTSSFEFGSEANGADSGTRDPHFQDYEVRVYDSSHKLLRTEHTTDNSYIYTFEKNVADGTHRRLTFEIAARDIFNHIGSPAVLDAYNPPPQVSAVTVSPAYDRVQINFVHTDDSDYAGAQIYLRWINDLEVSTVPAYDGPDTSVLLTNLMFNSDYYFHIVPYDAFGLDETIPSQEFHFVTPYMDVNAIAAGVLKDSQLIPALQTRINLVDAPASIIGSVNERVNTAKTLLSSNLTTAITAEQTIRQSATDSLASQIATVSASAGSNAALIQSEQTTRATADGALSTRIDTVASQTSGNTALITTETNARTSADSALSTRIDLVAANTGSNTAAVQVEADARTAADSALATQITTVAASFGVDPTNLCANPVGSNGTTGWSGLTVMSKTLSDVPSGAPAANVFKQNQRDSLFTGRIVDVTPGQQHYLELNAATPVAAATLTLGLRLLTSSGTAAFMPAATLAATKTWTRIAGSVTIPAGYVQAELWININITGTDDANRWYFTDVEWRPASITQPAMAAISTEQTARASADGALSTRIDSVNASLGTTNANVQTEISARAAGDTAQANYTTQVNSKVDSNTASISSAWSSIGGLNAQYTVKIDNNGYVSGFGLASYPVGQGIVSEFAVRADTFSIQLPGYPGIRPFTVGAVYGNPQVIINSAIIGDAAINTAKIGDAQITAAKIGSAQIQTAHIGTAQIDTLRIAGNAVTTMASWGGTGDPTYYASGGDVLVFISANCGMYNSTTGSNQAGSATVTVNGQYLAISNDRGDRASSFMRITGMNGAYTVSIRASGSNVSNVQTAIFEAKR